MDYKKIKNLLWTKEYDLAIEKIIELQLSGTKDEELDFLLAQAYFMNKQYEIALALLENMIDYSSKKYFDILYLQCQTLIKLDDLNKAKEIIEEELEQPCMPLEWNNKFNDLHKEIVVATLKDPNSIMLSDEDFEEKLFSENEVDNLIAVNFLRKVLATRYLDVIEEYLSKEENSYKIKTLLLEVLMDQKVDCVVSVSKFNKLHEINTATFNNNNNGLALKEIETMILEVSDNTTIIQFSKELFVHYYAYYFPKVVLEDELYRAIINTACEFLGEKPLFNDDHTSNKYFEIIGKVKF